MGKKIKTVFVGLGIMILFMLVQLVVALIGTVAAPIFYGMMASSEGSLQEFILSLTPLLQFLAEIGCIVVFGCWYYFGFVKKDKVNGTYESCISKIKSVKTILFLVCFTVVFYAIASIISIVVTALMPKSEEIFNALMGIATNDTILSYLTIMLFAPIAEELAFRGVIFKYSKKSFGIVGCAVLSALLFGLMHFNPLQSLYAIPIGAALAYIAYKYDSVIPAIIGHVINNSIAMIIPLVFQKEFGLWVYLIIVIVFGALAFFLARTIPEIKKKAA